MIFSTIIPSLTHLIQYKGKLPLHLMPGKYKLGLVG